MPERSILLVEDNEDSAAAMAELLRLHGYVVKVAASVHDALNLAEEADVLVSDIAMPGEDGYDLIHRVRELPADAGGLTPAVALTAYVRIEDQHAAIAAGYQRHIKKPVVVAELIAVVVELAALKVD